MIKQLTHEQKENLWNRLINYKKHIENRMNNCDSELIEFFKISLNTTLLHMYKQVQTPQKLYNLPEAQTLQLFQNIVNWQLQNRRSEFTFSLKNGQVICFQEENLPTPPAFLDFHRELMRRTKMPIEQQKQQQSTDNGRMPSEGSNQQQSTGNQRIRIKPPKQPQSTDIEKISDKELNRGIDMEHQQPKQQPINSPKKPIRILSPSKTNPVVADKQIQTQFQQPTRFPQNSQNAKLRKIEDELKIKIGQLNGVRYSMEQICKHHYPNAPPQSPNDQFTRLRNYQQQLYWKISQLEAKKKQLQSKSQTSHNVLLKQQTANIQAAIKISPNQPVLSSHTTKNDRGRQGHLTSCTQKGRK